VATLGAVPRSGRASSGPAFDLARLPDLVGIAFALTIVSLAQSISIAKAVADARGNASTRTASSAARASGNVVGAFASSYVACGSLNRSMPNYEAGARTPLAAVFASAWLLLLVALMAPLLGLLPLAAIAGCCS
jgi:SulP family sulfate permease